MCGSMVLVNNNKATPIVESTTRKTYDLKAEMKKAGDKVLYVVRENWAWLEKAFGVAKSSIKARIQLRPKYPLTDGKVVRLQNSIQHMKLFAFLNLPLDAMHLPATAREIRDSIRLKDKEGAVLSAMTFVILTADMFDSFTDVVNASLLLSGKPALGGFFNVVGVPVVMTMVGLSAISKGVQIWNVAKFDKEVKQLFAEKVKEDQPGETRQALLDFLNEKLGPQCRKTSRHQGGKTVELLQSLKQKLEANESLQQKDMKEIGKAIKDIRQSVAETKKVAKWSLVAFSVMFVAFSLFYTAVPLVIPFVMLAVGFAARLSIWAYQKHFSRQKTDVLDTVDAG